MSALKWDCGGGGDSRMGGHRARAGAPHSAGQEKDIRTPALGSAPSSEWVGVPGGTSKQGLLGLPQGSLRASVYPSVGKGPALMSLRCSGMPGSSGDQQPHAKVTPQAPAPTSGSSIQPERIKEGSEKINKHTGKTQTNPAAANEANSLYANRCLALTHPLRGEDTTWQHQLPSAHPRVPAGI